MALSLDRQNRYRERYRRLKPGWQPASEAYEALIRQALQPGMRVVDIGCGRGGVLEQLGDAVTCPLGFDPDLTSLREHRLPALPRAAALSSALPLPAQSVDVVLSSWVFEHLDHPERAFAELGRVLRTGGRALFLTPDARSLVVRLNRLLRPAQRWLVPRLYGRAEADTFPVRYLANTPRALERLSSAAGLRLERLLRIEDPTYLAFTPWLFRLSILASRITPPVHLAGSLLKA